MAMEIKAEKYEIEVIFTPENISTDPFTYRVDGGGEQPDFKLRVDVPLAWIELKLKSREEAAFTTSPIQWIWNQLPAPKPPQFSVQRRNQLEVMILNINEAGTEPQTFGIEISVMYQGKTYTSPDPTIVNTEPPHFLLEPESSERPGLAA